MCSRSNNNSCQVEITATGHKKCEFWINIRIGSNSNAVRFVVPSVFSRVPYTVARAVAIVQINYHAHQIEQTMFSQGVGI